MWVLCIMIRYKVLTLLLFLLPYQEAVAEYGGMYLCISSSGAIWERKRRKRFKPLKMKYCSTLEDGYQRHQLETLASAPVNEGNGRKVLEHKLEVTLIVFYCHLYGT